MRTLERPVNIGFRPSQPKEALRKRIGVLVHRHKVVYTYHDDKEVDNL